MTPCSNSLLIWFLITSIFGGDNLYGAKRITLLSLKFILYSIRSVSPNLGVRTLENWFIEVCMFRLSLPSRWPNSHSWCFRCEEVVLVPVSYTHLLPFTDVTYNSTSIQPAMSLQSRRRGWCINTGFQRDRESVTSAILQSVDRSGYCG